MRKILLLTLVIGFGFYAVAQHHTVKSHLKTEKAIDRMAIGYEPINAASMTKAKTELPSKTYKNSDFVSIVQIGTSANAYGYGYGGGQKSLLWANKDLNTVTNFHRMGGALDPGGYSGDLGYDISIDGGMTWANMNELYVAVNNVGGEYYTDAARYPNHGIYNPPGNTDPNEAYLTYFAPTLDGTNDIWGGYGYGRRLLGDPNDTIRHLETSRPDEGVMLYIPDGFTVTNLGEAWVTDINQDWTSGTMVYLGQIYVRHGIWDEDLEDFVYEELFFDLPTIDNGRPNNTKVAFSPDGMTGWIACLADNGEVAISEGLSYYPILWKTEDGGQNWSDPIIAAIAGEDGIGGIHNFLSDEELAELYEAPVPDREEIPFTTSFDFDMHVDAFGNPHIAVICGVTGADPYSIVTGLSESSGYIFTCAADIFTLDDGETWMAHELGRQKTFRGTFGTDYTEDNRIQIASSWDGTKMFVTWLDTDLPGVTDNNQPDIWLRGIDVVNNTLTSNNGEDKPYNVTEFSEGMWQAYFNATSHYVFDDGDGNYTIPMSYQIGNPEDPGIEVQFYYITDFTVIFDEFIYPGIEDLNSKSSFEVSQNFPNPANGTTTVTVSLEEATTLSFELFNLMGQKVFEVQAQHYSNGVQPFTFDASNLSDGVYFYTVTSGETKVTKKMIVE